MMPPASRSSSGATPRIARPGVISSRMNSCSSVVTLMPPPSLSDQVLAQHLAGRAPGDLLEELDLARRLVVGQPLPAEADQLALAARTVRHHHRLDDLLALDAARGT